MKVICNTKEEAEAVVTGLKNALVRYKWIALSDLHDLIDVPNVYENAKVGWKNLGEVPIKESEGKYVISLPQPEPI
jgi:hypothetical protein